MDVLDREALLSFLNEMLEAERAGARVALQTSREQISPDLQELTIAIHHDEARWCALLIKAIRQLDGVASEKTGAFYEKAMAIADIGQRLAFLNKGQAWVVRKLREVLPKIGDEKLCAELNVMLTAHQDNIDKVASLGL